MELRKKICLVLFVFVTLIVSCKCDDETDTGSRIDNQKFINEAFSINQFESDAGNLAQMKSLNEEIKQYGIYMVRDHNSIGQDIIGLSVSKSWMVPAELAQEDKKNLGVLSGLTGAEFDKEFISQMVMSYRNAVSLFSMAAAKNGVPDGDLRDFANRKLPVYRRHFDEVSKLEKKIE